MAIKKKNIKTVKELIEKLSRYDGDYKPELNLMGWEDPNFFFFEEDRNKKVLTISQGNCGL